MRTYEDLMSMKTTPKYKIIQEEMTLDELQAMYDDVWVAIADLEKQSKNMMFDEAQRDELRVVLTKKTKLENFSSGLLRQITYLKYA